MGAGARRGAKALTINAAEILGVADRIGSLEPGKIANLFIAKGDPLEVRTADHPCDHRRPRRAARQQAPRAVRALREAAAEDMKRLLPFAASSSLPFIALRADAPDVYAIRGARIVTAAGAPIESGTIVIRSG